LIELDWQKNINGNWNEFWCLDLSNPQFYNLEGLYIIFDSNKEIVYAGWGIIRDRILVHQADLDFHDYPEKLFITWAKADYYTQITGSRFLQLKYKPPLNKNLPNPLEGQIYIPLPF
jgi:hypothetical protein